MKKIHVVYFRKYIASFLIMLSVLVVGAVALFGRSDVVYTSNIVNGAYYSGEEESNNVAVSVSRISPTMTISGSARRTERRAVAKVIPALVFI